MGPNSCTVLYSIQACPLVPQWSSNTACHRCNIPHMHAQARSSPLACALHMTDRAVRCCSGCRQSGARARSSAARGARSTGTISAAAYTLLSTAAGTSRRDSRKTFAQGPSAVTAVLPAFSEPDCTAAWRDRTLRAATGLRAQDNGELGADDHTLRRAARLQCCTVHVVSQPAHRRPPSPPHMRFWHGLLWQRGFGLRIGECHQRWTGWRLSGVRAQSRAAWGSSSAWCASLPSSAFELLLVHPSMSPAQPLEYPWHPPCTACSGQIATLRHAIRRSVAVVNHGRLAGWPASPPAINSALLPSTAP